MEKIAQSVEDIIGKSPLLKLSGSLKNPPLGKWLKEEKGLQESQELAHGELLAKLEFMNPGGSVKDRIALKMIDAAEERGDLKPGATIIESTSGNTGAGLAMLAAIRGYQAIFVMPDKISSEKINALRAYGAQVYVCPTHVAPEDPKSYYSVAKKLVDETESAFHANQYFNPDNPLAHYESTAPEIWDDCGGKLDYFICGIGTGGTVSGIGKYLKEKNPQLKVIAVDPLGSIYYDRICSGKEVEAHSYLVEGVGEDIIPSTIDFSIIDDCVRVWDEESFSATRMLAQKEGILVGGSCGFAFYGALQYLQLEESRGVRDYRAVVMLPDSGSRYLSKVFNPQWLNAHEVGGDWSDLKLGAAVHYVQDAKKIEGVE